MGVSRLLLINPSTGLFIMLLFTVKCTCLVDTNRRETSMCLVLVPRVLSTQAATTVITQPLSCTIPSQICQPLLCTSPTDLLPFSCSGEPGACPTTRSRRMKFTCLAVPGPL